MLKLLIALLGLAACGMAAAQSPACLQPLLSSSDSSTYGVLRNGLISQYSNSWNIGSAKKLEGKVFLLEVWLTSPGSRWTYLEVLRMQRRINEALDWLAALASGYGKSLEFVKGSYHGDGMRGIEMDSLPASFGESSRCAMLLAKSLRMIGYVDIMHCYNTLCKNFGCSSVAVLVLINHAGRCCTNNFSLGHTINGFENYFLENAFIFKTSSGRPTGSQVIAHELMHIFGAWDMYGGQVSREAAAWAQDHYPNEIMLQVSSPLAQLDISPLNAWLTGLSPDFSDWYMNFQRVDNAAVSD